jgi:transposase
MAERALASLVWWCDVVEDSGIVSLQKYFKSFKSHWSGIVNWYDHKNQKAFWEP